MKICLVISSASFQNMMFKPFRTWDGVKNGTLLNLAESIFDIFLTADKNLPYQQNLSDIQLGIVVFPSNKLSVVKSIEEQLKAEIRVLKAGDLVEL